MPVEKVWRWWSEAPTSTVLKEASAQEYLLRLAEYAREFYGVSERHPPVGFIFRKDGGVTVIPDLDELPPPMWGPAAVVLANSQDVAGDYYALVCEATIAVAHSAKEAKEAVESDTPVKEMKNAREGVLLMLRDMRHDPMQMLFLPQVGKGKLGEVETPADDHMAN